MVRQRQVPTAFRVPLRVWNRSFLREALRCTHSDSGHYSYVHLVTGWHSAPVFSGQYVAASGRISDIFCVVSAPEQSEHGNWTLLLRPSLSGLPRAGVLGSCDRFSLCSPWCSLSLSLFKARFEEFNVDYFVLQNGVVCTVDALIALRVFALGNGTLFSTSLLYFPHFPTFQVLRESIFWSPRTLTGVSARGLGVGAVTPGVHSQVLDRRLCIIITVELA